VRDGADISKTWRDKRQKQQEKQRTSQDRYSFVSFRENGFNDYRRRSIVSLRIYR